MTLLEFVAAVVLAVYAMIGGAFINAAIASPANMRRLLVAGWPTIFEFLLYGLGYVLAAIIFAVLAWPDENLAMNPFLWLSTAHFALYLTFLGCRRITEILLGKAEDQKPDEEEAVETGEPG